MEALTIKEILLRATAEIGESSASPRLDAELLLCAVSELSRVQLISRDTRVLSAEQLSRFGELVARRKAGEPIAYILGEKEFFGLPFKVTPAVLIPRPDTEILVEAAFAETKYMPKPIRLLDLGTGSGCIALSLAAGFSRFEQGYSIVAIDRCQDALDVARENSESLGLGDRIEFRCGEWFEPLTPGEKFSVIVSNPPYVIEGDPEASPEIRFEPHGALYAAEQGLADVRYLLSRVEEFLVPQGVFFCEIGAGQSEMLKKEYGAQFGERLSFIPDLAGHSRVLRLGPA